MTETTTIILPTWAAIAITVAAVLSLLALLDALWSVRSPPWTRLRRPKLWGVHLKFVGSMRLNVIKEIRDRTGLGLKEAKEASERWPILVGVDLDEDSAASYREALRAAGALAEIVTMREAKKQGLRAVPGLARSER